MGGAWMRKMCFESLEDRRMLAIVPAFSSYVGSINSIYLDFDGHEVSDAYWTNPTYDGFGNTVTDGNNGQPIHAPIYNMPGDADYDSQGNALPFSQQELEYIERAWRLVAEDFAPFDVNVTTVEPPSSHFTTGGPNGERAIRILFTSRRDDQRIGGTGTDWVGNDQISGISAFDAWQVNVDRPVWVFANQFDTVTTWVHPDTHGAWAPIQEYMGTIASHEVGHGFGLTHDGDSHETGILAGYYGGHGSDEVSWGAIMGGSELRNLTQWSQGEYSGANNSQDDLAIIASYLGYRDDDHGNSLSSSGSTLLTVVANAFSATGIIGGSTGTTNGNDLDVFRIDAGPVPTDLQIQVNPVSVGPNLDVAINIFDADTLSLVATVNPPGALNAAYSYVGQGSYYVQIDGVGLGDPLGIGYTDYGSLGQYTISGTAVALLAGDYNRDSQVNAADYTLWRNTLDDSVGPFTGADGDGNGLVNQADYRIWAANFGAATGRAIGDFNLDGIVNWDDYFIWYATFSPEPEVPTDYRADANGDGWVDAADYTIWRDTFGSTVAAPQFGLLLAAVGDEASPTVVAMALRNATAGYDFASSIGSGEQLRRGVLLGANAVSLTFSQDVTVTQSDLTLINLDGSAPSIANFAYDSQSQTATWTFASAFADGRYLVRLSDTITNWNDEQLDGEFTNPWSLTDTGTSIFPSGDGIEGGEFRFRFTILSGDTDGDNIDGSTNYTTWHSHEPGLALVTTTTDEFDYGYAYGDLSLREAIYLANTASEYTTVIVPTGYYALTLTGSETTTPLVGVNDLDVLADQRLIGDGPGRTIIDASALIADGVGLHDRLLEVSAGEEFTISGVTLTGGHVRATTGSNALGGAIYTRPGSTLNLSDAALVNNHVDRVSGSTTVAAGGALALYGHATIDRSVFADNSAYSTGGAAYVIDDAGAPPDYIVTVANSVFAHNVATSSNGTQNVRTGSTVTSLGNNLADADTAGVEAVFDVTGASADYVGTAPTYIVTSIVDTFDHSDDAYAVSLREAIDLSNGSSASNKEIWLPGWDFLLTRGGNLNVAESTYGPNLVDRLFQGDLDIAGSLTLRGVRGATSVGWAPSVQTTFPAGVTDKVFELIGDYNDDRLVDAADYTVWADSQGETGPNLAADGDEDGDVDTTDNSIRVAAFGNLLALIDVAVD